MTWDVSKKRLLTKRINLIPKFSHNGQHPTIIGKVYKKTIYTSQ